MSAQRVLRYWRIRGPLARFLRTGHAAWQLSVLLGCGNRSDLLE